MHGDPGAEAQPDRSSTRRWQGRLLREKLERILDSGLLPEGGELLDYGCGSRPFEPLFQTRFDRYIGVDLTGNERADLTIQPGGPLPQPSGSIDCVLSTQVLEHVERPDDYLREAYRVLKPGGCLVLSTHGIWPYHPTPTDYWRWTIDGLRMQMGRAGFEVLKVHGIFSLTSVALQLWQDGTVGFLPRALKGAYVRLFQAIIGFVERRNPEKCSANACVFVVVARRPR
jgi:SAM-dependent methyltransferase